MATKTLYVQTVSGLASRMRAVIAGVCWAKAHDAEVCVCWPWQDPSETLGVHPVWFSELFESPLREIRMPKPEREPKWRARPQECEDGWRIRFCEPEKLDVEHLDLTGWPYEKLWQPSRDVQQQIDTVTLHWPATPVVGVHIRHSLAQNTTPPVDWFLARMRSIRDDFPHVEFFLSTDALTVQEQVEKEFPGVLRLERTYQYDTLGIKRAAADLFLLKRCAWMIGSYNSSYSELAGWMRGGAYLPGWGRPGWLPGGRYEDGRTPAELEELQTVLGCGG